MIISREKGFIFSSVPKTASTAIEAELVRHEDFISETLYKRHAPFWEIKDQVNLSEYFTFCFFRNPWDLLVSKYFFYRQADIPVGVKNRNGVQLWDFNKMEFSRFIQSDLFSRLTYEYQRALQTQMDYIRGVEVEKVYRFEDLSESIKDIEGRLGIVLDLEMKNTSKHSHYRDYYDKHTRAIVSDRWGESIELMGYTF